MLPTHDELGAPCTVPADGLGLRIIAGRGDLVIDETGRERVYDATVQVRAACAVHTRHGEGRAVVVVPVT